MKDEFIKKIKGEIKKELKVGEINF